MKKLFKLAVVLAIAGAAVFFWLTATSEFPAADIPAHTPDLANGERLYNAGGCLSCHNPGKNNKTADKSLPSGGRALHTPVGTFYPPNLTPDKDTGIGNWSDAQFVNAVMRGVSPGGQHYFPAFPFTSYTHMKIGDVLDIKAYLFSLKAVKSETKAPGIPLLWFVRRGLGMWKLLALDTTTFTPDKAQSDTWNRGAYLVRGPGHCNECHTPRNFMMISRMDRFLAGGPHPEGKGKVPSLRDLTGRKRFKDADDLNAALRFGEAFGYDKISSGGMGEVQTNMSKLPDADTMAIAGYIISLK